MDTKKNKAPNLVRKARANFHLSALTDPKRPLDIIIEEIPESIEPFLESGDKWGRIKFPGNLDITGCVYKAKKGNYFWKHKHPDNGEILLILNKKGKARVYTEEDYYDISFMQSCFIPKDMFHAVKWEEDTDVLIIWEPSFKQHNWKALVDNYKEDLEKEI